jgi:hypothetical protein
LRALTGIAVTIVFGFAGCSDKAKVRDPTVRPDLFFGYYGDCPNCIEETRDHTSFQWIAGWKGSTGQISTIVERATKAAPTRTVIMLPGMYVNKRVNPNAIEAARKIFVGLRKNHVLQNVVALYPQDEPDRLGIPDEAIAEANTQVRAVAAEFDELEDVPLAVIYSGTGRHPGMSTYDWVGIDSYRLGRRVLAKPYSELVVKMRPEQRLLLVPGGASPWVQDPEPFFRRATEDDRVIGIVAFIWFDYAATGVERGIRSNGLADRYRKLGAQAKGSTS